MIGHEHTSRRYFYSGAALLAIVCGALTIAWSAPMASSAPTRLCSGLLASVASLRMPGESMPNAALSFLGLWMVMTVAMMSPSAAPMLWRFREIVPDTNCRDRCVAMAALSYAIVWVSVGVVVFIANEAIATILSSHPSWQRSLPLAACGVVALAGAFQFTPWKARLLACCRDVSTCARSRLGNMRSAWMHGLWKGLHCAGCCAGPTAILLMVGLMDLRAMAVFAAVLFLERVETRGMRIAHASGALMLAAAAVMAARLIETR